MNEDLDVPTHSERPSSSRDRRYECTNIVASGVKHSDPAVKTDIRTSKQERCVKTLVK